MFISVLTLSGCSTNQYQKFYREFNKTFKNKPVEMTIGISTNPEFLTTYENIEKEQFYIKVDNLEMFANLDNIYYSNGDKVYTTEYKDEAVELFNLENDFNRERYSIVQLIKPNAEVTNELLSDEFTIYRPVEDNVGHMNQLFYQQDDGTYTIEGQEGILSFDLTGGVYTGVEDLGLTKVIEKYVVKDDLQLTTDVSNAQLVDFATLKQQITKDLEVVDEKVVANVESYSEANPEKVAKFLKDNKAYIMHEYLSSDEIGDTLASLLGEE